MKRKTKKLLARCLEFISEELEVRKEAQLEVSDPYTVEPAKLVVKLRKRLSKEVARKVINIDGVKAKS